MSLRVRRTASTQLRAVALLIGLVALASCGTATTANPLPSSNASQTSESRQRWMPKPGVTWQWQLSGKIDTTIDAEVFELDAEVPSAALKELRAQGRRTICYVSAGSWENYRPDAKRFPKAVLGKRLDGYPDERWLDIRRTKTLKPLMAKRFDRCAKRGFDAIEADNVDGYTNKTGFRLKAADQLRYNRMLATLAHRRGLSIGLKNDVDQIGALVKYFDFAVNEECLVYRECEAYRPFIKANKAVFHAEYDPKVWNPKKTKRLGFSSVLKDAELTAWRKE